MVEPDYALMERLAERARLAGGGGGSDDGGMERRVAALEADMREIKLILSRMEPMLRGIDDRLRKVETDLARLDGKVSQLPTTWTLMTGAIGLVLGTFGFAFALVRLALPN